MLVNVMYTVPVMAEVDTDAGTVTRVIVLDEDVRLSDSEGCYTESGEEITHAPHLVAESIRIAETAEWPAWRFGL